MDRLCHHQILNRQIGTSVILMFLCVLQFACDSHYPGEKSLYHSFDRYDFIYNERPCIIVAPKKTAPGKPWIWRARFFTHEPQVDLALLEKDFIWFIPMSQIFMDHHKPSKYGIAFMSISRKHTVLRRKLFWKVSAGAD